jgi:ABC-2 type transport system permease protein
MVGIVAAIVDISALRYLSPFRYVNYSQVAIGHGYEASYIIVAIIGVLTLLFISYIRYTKRDEGAV